MINRVVLIGRLTHDPEVRYTQSGVAVLSFSIAVERNFKNASGEKETDFINCVAWRKAAELLAEYTKKGYMVGVEGSLQMRKYQTKEGENRTVYEVLVENFQFLDRGGSKGDSSGGSAPPRDEDAPPSISGNDAGGSPEDDDLPF